MKKQIALIGTGGCGSNILNAILEKHVGLTTSSMAINRDEKAIEKSQAAEKVFLKAHSEKQVEREIERHKMTICQFLKDKDGLILLAGMGGFTGTYASSLIAGFSRGLNLPILAFITLPFGFEGSFRMECAQKGEKHLVAAGATVMAFPNQTLLKNVPAGTSMLDAFRIVDQEVLKLIESHLLS